MSVSEALDQELHDWLTQTPDDVRVSAVKNRESSAGLLLGVLAMQGYRVESFGWV